MIYTAKETWPNGSVVRKKTSNFAPTNRYNIKSNPAETVAPNDGYTIQSGQLYTLTVTAIDADDTTATSTIQDTA